MTALSVASVHYLQTSKRPRGQVLGLAASRERFCDLGLGPEDSDLGYTDAKPCRNASRSAASEGTTGKTYTSTGLSQPAAPYYGHIVHVSVIVTYTNRRARRPPSWVKWIAFTSVLRNVIVGAYREPN